LNFGERTTHIVPEEARVSTHGKQLLLLISLVAVGLNPESLNDGHDEGGGDESEVVVVEEGEGFGSSMDDSTSGESESEEEGREGCSQVGTRNSELEVDEYWRESEGDRREGGRNETREAELTVDLVRQPSSASKLSSVDEISREELPSRYGEGVPSEVDEEGRRVEETREPVELGEVWDPLSERSWAAGGRGAREVESVDGDGSEESENGSAEVSSELDKEEEREEEGVSSMSEERRDSEGRTGRWSRNHGLHR